MTNNIILGWSGEIDPELLFFYKIEFSKPVEKLSTLNYYIRKGEYRSNIAFGILTYNGLPYIMSNKDNLTKSRIIINKLVIKIQNQIKLVIKLEEHTETLNTFLYTFFELIFVENLNYQKPINTRTFLGKYSKGKLVDRNNIETEIEINVDQTMKTVQIYPALNFDIFTQNTSFCLTIVPNYEIYNDILDLPFNKNIISKLDENEEYKKTIYQTPKKIFERYSIIDKELCKNIERYEIIKNFNKRINFDETELEYPKKLHIMNQEVFIRFDKSIPFKNQILTFLKDIAPLEEYELTVIVDDFESSIENKNLLNNYLQKLSESRLFKIIELNKIKKKEDFPDNITSNILLIVNDETKGFEFLYLYTKKSFSVSKIIKISTLRKITFDDYHFYTIWLSFYHRNTQKFIWYHSSFHFTKIIAISAFFDTVYGDHNFHIAVFDTKNTRISYYNKSFQITQNESLDDILNNFLIDIGLNIDKEELFIFEDGQFSKEIEISLINRTNLVKISTPKIRIVDKEESNIVHPQNGLCLKIFSSTNDYLLITTGVPDIPEKGLPNPLKISILSKFCEERLILQTLYNLTFMPAESFEKLHRPVILEYNIRKTRLFRKDQIEIIDD